LPPNIFLIYNLFRRQKTKGNRKMAEADFEAMLQEGRLAVPPLEIRVLASQTRGPDAFIDVAWRGRSYCFAAELRRDAKPLTLKVAIEQVRRQADPTNTVRPMIVAPYFSGEKLDQLLEAGISAIDFSGNAVINVPGKFLFYKTGNPNKYPNSTPIRSAYRGDGSLVARVLLLEREFQAVGAIREAIRSRGGALTLSMISKVLKRLEADLAIERSNRYAVRVLQPERLLDGLLEAYRPPRRQATWTGKVPLPVDSLLARLQRITSDGDVVRTGEASAVEYASWAGEPVIACYCRAKPPELLARLGVEAKETLAFANLRLVQTDDQLVYFDARPNLAASPIQAFLEMASGDKRQKEVAGQIRRAILSATGTAK
jgi:hypothetical protein